MNIGYKATCDGWCNKGVFPLKYEIGKTYEYFGQIDLCVSGLHYCQKLEDVFLYYTPDNKMLKVFKIEVLGSSDSSITKSVTNKLRVIEEVDISKWHRFDSNGDLVYIHFVKDNVEFFQEFNSNHKLVHRCIKFEDEIRNTYYASKTCYMTYNESGFLVEEKDNGVYIKNEYNSNNKIMNKKIYDKDDNLLEELKYQYDEFGDLIIMEKYKNCIFEHSIKRKREYLEDGIVETESQIESEGEKVICKKYFNAEEKLIRCDFFSKDNSVSSIICTYDADGNIVFEKSRNGIVTWRNFENNKLISESCGDVMKQFRYDDNGQLITVTKFYPYKYISTHTYTKPIMVVDGYDGNGSHISHKESLISGQNSMEHLNWHIEIT